MKGGASVALEFIRVLIAVSAAEKAAVIQIRIPVTRPDDHVTVYTVDTAGTVRRPMVILARKNASVMRYALWETLWETTRTHDKTCSFLAVTFCSGSSSHSLSNDILVFKQK